MLCHQDGLSSVLSVIRIVSNQYGLISNDLLSGGLSRTWSSHQCGLSSVWSVTGVVCHQCGLSLGWPVISVVCHWGGLSSVRSVIRIVSNQYGLSSGWSVISVACYQDGLLSLWSLITVVCHQDAQVNRDETHTKTIQGSPCHALDKNKEKQVIHQGHPLAKSPTALAHHTD